MTPSGCNHPCAPRSASSVYCLLTRLGLLDPLTDSTSIASIQDHSNAVHGPLQPGFCREQHHLSAHSSCSVFLLCPLALPTAGAPSGRQHARKRSEQRRKVGRQSTISRGDFAIKTGRDMSEGGVRTGKNRSTATKTCWRRKMALTAAQTMARPSLPPKNRLFLPT